MRKRIYLSGPISLGPKGHNLGQFLDVHEKLMHAGYAPLNPGLTMLLPFQADVRHAEWLASDLPWVEVSDAVLRLPGDSRGADQECAHAARCGIPIYHSFEEVLQNVV